MLAIISSIRLCLQVCALRMCEGSCVRPQWRCCGSAAGAVGVQWTLADTTLRTEPLFAAVNANIAASHAAVAADFWSYESSRGGHGWWSAGSAPDEAGVALRRASLLPRMTTGQPSSVWCIHRRRLKLTGGANMTMQGVRLSGGWMAGLTS